jgi:hypothetical protein
MRDWLHLGELVCASGSIEAFSERLAESPLGHEGTFVFFGLRSDKIKEILRFLHRYEGFLGIRSDQVNMSEGDIALVVDFREGKVVSIPRHLDATVTV